MIICRTPHRISLCGGGSDLKEYYKYDTGAILSFTINKYQYHFLNETFDNKTYLTYLDENEIVNSISDIKHTGLKNLLISYDIKNINYKITSDTYYNIGLGSSSCFYVSLFNILNEYKNLKLNKTEISELACSYEINTLNMPIGKQDQYASAFGGINLIEFNADETVNITSLNSIDFNKLSEKLILFKLDRFNSNEIMIEMKSNLYKNREIVKNMTNLSYRLKDNLIENNFDDIGSILNENWNYKKLLNNNISNEYIDHIYKNGLENGASGGKLLGSGGGGAILFYTDDKEKLRSVFNYLDEIKFYFDFDGTKIIYKS